MTLPSFIYQFFLSEYMRYLVALAILMTPLLIAQNPVMAEPSGNYGISGEIAFDNDMSENVRLNISVESLSLDGTVLNSSDIRDIYRSDGEDWESVEKSIDCEAADMFNHTLWAVGSHPNSLLSVSIYGLNSEGALYLYVLGTGCLNISESAEFSELILASGGVLNIHAKAVDGANISISVPEGYLINNAKTYVWNGNSDVFAIKKSRGPRENTADIMMDIYRMDTSGMEQNLYMNLSIESEIYWIPIPDDLKKGLPAEVQISQASIALLNYSIEHALISYSDFERYGEQMLSEIEDRIVRIVPGVGEISHDFKIENSSLLVRIDAGIKAPVESFSASSFLRWYASQKISVKLAGMKGFICNYTVVVPEGMKILGASSSPKIPVFYMPVDGRSAFKAIVSEDGEYSVSVNVGILVDIDPLVPLIALSVLALIFWILVRKYVPERRKRHG